MFENFSNARKVEDGRRDTTKESAPSTEQSGAFTPEIRQKIQICLEDTTYANKQGEGFNKIKTLLGGEKSEEQKTNRLKSLLALELNADMEDVILKIETDLSARVSDKIFAKFAALASTIRDVDSLLKQNINSHEDRLRITAKIKKKQSRGCIRIPNNLCPQLVEAINMYEGSVSVRFQ